WLMMSLWDALRMNMMISYQELVRTFLKQDRTVNVFYTFFPSNSEAGHGDVVWSRDGRPIAYRSGR
ncbi:hypothetical protein, partial [Escherichia coli]|uniref:hypothetical protein n=1 Tax=Escherichia coli TaxID=562 RepID=UPI001BFBFED6